MALGIIIRSPYTPYSIYLRETIYVQASPTNPRPMGSALLRLMRLFQEPGGNAGGW